MAVELIWRKTPRRSNSSLTCLASSRVGANTNTSMVPGEASTISMMGIANAAVLPVPV